MSTFPTSTPSYAGFTPGHTLATDAHASQHNAEQADIIALANKVGTGASTPASGLVLTSGGAGTSSWSQVNLTTMVSGILPVANGGTGVTATTGSGSVVFSTSPTIATPAISNPTITGGGSWAGSPSLTTPTIADFTNAQHTHASASQGGILNTSVFNNPYKFRVYRHAALTLTAAALTSLPFDTKSYDTSSNVDIITNKGRFTVPINGYYHFDGRVSIVNAASARLIAFIRKNGVALGDSNLSRGNDSSQGTNPIGASVGDTIQCIIGDYIEFAYYSVNATAIEAGDDIAYFSGFLVSAT